MADNVAVTAGSGTTIAADEVSDGTLGSCKVQYVKLMDGTLNGTGKAAIDATNGLSVTLTTAIPAGTAAIGALTTINTSVTPGTSAAHLGKAEDAAHSSGDTGVMALTVRQDTAAALAGTDADYQPLITDSSGRLHVNVGNTVTVGSHAVTNAGTFATQSAITAASGSISSGAVSSGAIASGAVASGAVASGAFASGSIASGAVASGAVASGAFASGSIASGAIVAGAVAAGASSFVKLEDVASADADAGVPAMAIQKATAIDTGGTDGDYVMLQMSAGKLWVANASHGKTVLSTGGSAASSGNNTLISADATKRIKVKAFSLTTASTTAMTCIFQDGASGTELWRCLLQASTGTSTGANLSVSLPDFLFATTANTLLNLNISSANAIHWSVSYILEV